MSGDQAMTESRRQTPANTSGDWEELLYAARHVLDADEYIHPAMSREEARRQAFMRLKAAVDTFPHPCGAEETKR